jgi:hypothetical protein
LAALSFHATKADALLVGVAAGGGWLEVAGRFDDGGGAQDAVALGMRLPVKETAEP